MNQVVRTYIWSHWLVHRSARERQLACVCEARGIVITYPHQISFSDPGSFTILLSRGDRPVFAPEYAVRAPDEVMAEPVS